MSSLFDEMMEEICEKNQKIADLEAKLAESKERVKDLEFRNKNLEHSLKVAPNANAGQRARIVELKEINHKLKQQLAEKEKENNELHIAINKMSKDLSNTLLQRNQDEIKFAEKDNLLKDMTKNEKSFSRQDKISFAVEQLEKVKEKLIQNEDCYMISLGTIKNIIDNQIKQLKEGK